MPNTFKNLKNADLFRDGVLDTLGQIYVKILKDLLSKHQKRASGALINSIEYQIVQNNRDVIVKLMALDYLINVDQGRSPGSKMPPLSAISDWARIKGISQAAVYPIAKSIGEKGIRPINVIKGSEQILVKSPFYKTTLPNRVVDNLEDYIATNFQKIIDSV